jgi:hypothetical protein
MKACLHSGCIYPVFSHGYCKFHQGKRQDEKYKESRKSLVQKHMEKMKKEKKDDVVGEKSELDKWYDNIIEKHLKPFPYCSNCGEPIPEKYFRHAVAHIFPKNIFPSVATNEWNFVIAGAGCGCHNDTHRLDTFSKMEIFEVAIRKFKHFENQIKEHHKYLDEFKKLTPVEK